MVDLPGPVPPRGIAAPQRPQAQPVARGPAQASDDVAGKNLPQLVNLVHELASGPPPLDYAKIAQIRAAISTGSYRIDPERIAGALLGKGR